VESQDAGGRVWRTGKFVGVVMVQELRDHKLTGTESSGLVDGGIDIK